MATLDRRTLAAILQFQRRKATPVKPIEYKLLFDANNNALYDINNLRLKARS